MTKQEAIEILRDTPIDIRSTRGDDIHTLYATAQNMAIEALQNAGYMKWLEYNLLGYEPVGLTCDIFGGSEECEKVCEFQRECLYRAYQEEAMVMTNCGAEMKGE